MKKAVSTFITFAVISPVMLYAQILNQGYVAVGSDSLYYESAGSGETIIFIHDGVLPSAVWDSQVQFFSDNYRVIRYDRRGYGKSSPARGDYTNLDDLVTLFSSLGIDSACLVGASSGGALAIDMTLKYPEKVSSLVLVGAVVGGFSYTGHMRTRGGHLPFSFKNDVEEDMYYINDDPYLIYKDNHAAKEKAVRILEENPPRVLNGQRFIRQAIPPYRRLNEIKVPTLILAGEHDIPDVHAISGVLNAGICNSTRDIVPGCGHLVPLEKPDVCNALISEFLSR